ncbi:hypothetical protein RJ640_006938 [Escallonia rubra]|uniref:Aspartic peptidase DDI1-type domain-containing protein n=1 Tax=Escallonia rubra TaxID=112253 RepID=A0AA88Q895_9ASTE|nr:hypothetical protein RJ640_006938 [Escallonia rubra]
MSKGLLFVEAKLNGKPAQVLVDTGATHNFVTMDEAERLGLNVVDHGGWLKTINAEVKPLQGTVRRVEMCLGRLKGFVDFSVARVDDFKVVLGLDFSRQGAACAVPMFGGTPSTVTSTSMQLSGMRLVEGVKDVEAKGEGTYLASLKVKDNFTEVAEQPKEMVDVLKGKKDAMPWGQTMKGSEGHPQGEEGHGKGAEDVLKGKENVPLSEPPRGTKDVPKAKNKVVPCKFKKRKPPRRKVDPKGKPDQGVEPQNVTPCVMAPPKEEKLETTSKAKGETIKLIKEGLQRDPLAKELLKLVKSRKTQRYRVKGGLLYTRDGRVYVPKWRNLRRKVVQGSHDT